MGREGEGYLGRQQEGCGSLRVKRKGVRQGIVPQQRLSFDTADRQTKYGKRVAEKKQFEEFLEYLVSDRSMEGED